MAHRTWMVGLWLGLVGFAMATGCVVKSDDDDGTDEGVGGEAGDTGGGGTSTGGSATGGRGGSSTGGSGTGGTSGTGATGGTSGTGTGGTSGTGGTMNTMPMCDPDMGELDNDYFPNCTARPNNDCEDCIEESCCELSRVCYGFNPGNVCGWGGPNDDGEITCFITCAQMYVEQNDGVYDEAGADMCAGMCATEECGQIGNATNDMIVCLQDNCEARCFGTTE